MLTGTEQGIEDFVVANLGPGIFLGTPNLFLGIYTDGTQQR
jgi:hypothetical protein